MRNAKRFKQLNFDLNLISTISNYAPFLIGAFLYSRLSKPGQLLFYFALLTMLLDTTTRILYEFRINNMFLFHIHSYLEFYFIAFVYLKIISNKFSKQIIQVFFFAFGIGSILFLWQNDLHSFNTGQRYLEASLLVIILTLHLRDYPFRKNDLHSQFIWLTFGYLVYLFGTFFLYLSQEDLVELGDPRYWQVIHTVFNILLSGIISFVLWNSRRISWL